MSELPFLSRRHFIEGLIASVIAAGTPLPAGMRASRDRLIAVSTDPDIEFYLTDPTTWVLVGHLNGKPVRAALVETAGGLRWINKVDGSELTYVPPSPLA